MKYLSLLVSAFILCFLTSFKPEVKRAAYSTGILMPSIDLHDTSGKVVNLHDLKGKFIYYDFWASWCRPCMGEMQPTLQLQDQLKDEDITWVFISYDRDINTWKKTVKELNLKGIQLIASKEDIDQLKDELSIYSIPFNIWADSTNKIVKYDAPHPSEGISDKLLKTISKYE